MKSTPAHDHISLDSPAAIEAEMNRQQAAHAAAIAKLRDQQIALNEVRHPLGCLLQAHAGHLEAIARAAEARALHIELAKRFVRYVDAAIAGELSCKILWRVMQDAHLPDQIHAERAVAFIDSWLAARGAETAGLEDEIIAYAEAHDLVGMLPDNSPKFLAAKVKPGRAA